MGIAAFQPRRTFHSSKLRQIGGETDQQILADIDVRDFASAELHHSFDAVAFLQESNRVVLLKFVVMIVGVGAILVELGRVARVVAVLDAHPVAA